jgi:uncharacterized glyoxalase superfamily protein PhnB
MKKLTPVLVVDAIEPCLNFWIERLGFTKVASVPEQGALDFVILAHGSVEIMYQTKASVAADIPAAVAGPLTPSTFLYIEVEELDPIIEALHGIDPVVPLRNTFYGAREFGVREPAGNCVTFAEYKHAE